MRFELDFLWIIRFDWSRLRFESRIAQSPRQELQLVKQSKEQGEESDKSSREEKEKRKRKSRSREAEENRCAEVPTCFSPFVGSSSRKAPEVLHVIPDRIPRFGRAPNDSGTSTCHTCHLFFLIGIPYKVVEWWWILLQCISVRICSVAFRIRRNSSRIRSLRFITPNSFMVTMQNEEETNEWNKRKCKTKEKRGE